MRPLSLFCCATQRLFLLPFVLFAALLRSLFPLGVGEQLPDDAAAHRCPTAELFCVLPACRARLRVLLPHGIFRDRWRRLHECEQRPGVAAAKDVAMCLVDREEVVQVSLFGLGQLSAADIGRGPDSKVLREIPFLGRQLLHEVLSSIQYCGCQPQSSDVNELLMHPELPDVEKRLMDHVAPDGHEDIVAPLIKDVTCIVHEEALRNARVIEAVVQVLRNVLRNDWPGGGKHVDVVAYRTLLLCLLGNKRGGSGVLGKC